MVKKRFWVKNVYPPSPHPLIDSLPQDNMHLHKIQCKYFWKMLKDYSLAWNGVHPVNLGIFWMNLIFNSSLKFLTNTSCIFSYINRLWFGVRRGISKNILVQIRSAIMSCKPFRSILVLFSDKTKLNSLHSLPVPPYHPIMIVGLLRLGE